MKNNLLRHVTLLVAAVLLSTSFWSCSKDDDLEPAPSAISVTGVTLNKSTLSIQVGGSETLTATVAPKDASNKKVTWKSSNEAVATVANGKVTGVKAGEVTINGHEHLRRRQRDPDRHHNPRERHQPEGNVEVERRGYCLRGCQW